jgi:spore maturation protein CgeB
MIERVAILVNYNLYESKREFVKSLKSAFERKNVIVEIFDISQMTPHDGVEMQLFAPDFICSFNSMLPNKEGKYFFEILKIPFVSFLVDPSFYSLNLTKSPYSIITCVDRYDCEVIKSQNFDRVLFLPHAIDKDIPLKNEKRDLDVVFLGSCYDYESLQEHWNKTLSKELIDILETAIPLVLSDKHIPLLQALVAAWQESNLKLDQTKFAQLFYYLDNYTRGKDRVELIRAIENYPVHIFGEMMATDPLFKKGWDYYLKRQKNVTLHKSVPFTETASILSRSKICLNSMPFFKNGSHERVFLSLACGAIPLTSESLFIEEAFKKGKELLIYQPGHWEEVENLIDVYLKDETKRSEMARLGRQKVLEHHTWDNRVETLLNELPPILKRI